MRQARPSGTADQAVARGVPTGTPPPKEASKPLDLAIGERLRQLRASAGMSLGELSRLAGVSKAMIARVEKAESSASAVLLGKLCAGLGVTLSSVVALSERPFERLVRRDDQPVWRDPETGYRRRHVSPLGKASGIEIIDVELPAGAQVPYSPWGARAYTQQLFMLSGTLRLWVGDEPYDLSDGDCLDFDVLRPLIFQNPGEQPARYMVVIRNR